MSPRAGGSWRPHPTIGHGFRIPRSAALTAKITKIDLSARDTELTCSLAPTMRTHASAPRAKGVYRAHYRDTPSRRRQHVTDMVKAVTSRQMAPRKWQSATGKNTMRRLPIARASVPRPLTAEFPHGAPTCRNRTEYVQPQSTGGWLQLRGHASAHCGPAGTVCWSMFTLSSCLLCPDCSHSPVRSPLRFDAYRRKNSGWLSARGEQGL